jgi:hypothetical protein
MGYAGGESCPLSYAQTVQARSKVARVIRNTDELEIIGIADHLAQTDAADAAGAPDDDFQWHGIQNIEMLGECLPVPRDPPG